jgi:hypothetical protein
VGNLELEEDDGVNVLDVGIAVGEVAYGRVKGKGEISTEMIKS